MTTILVAQATPTGFQRVRTIQVRRDGGFALPPTLAGSLKSRLWRGGVATLLADAAIQWVDVQYGPSPTYRLSSY